MVIEGDSKQKEIEIQSKYFQLKKEEIPLFSDHTF